MNSDIQHDKKGKMKTSSSPETFIISLSSNPKSKELVKDVFKYKKQKFPTELAEELFTVYLNENHKNMKVDPKASVPKTRSGKLFGIYSDHYNNFEQNILLSSDVVRCFVFCIDLDHTRVKDEKNFNVIGYGAVLRPDLVEGISMSVNIKKTHTAFATRLYKFVALETRKQGLVPTYLTSEQKSVSGFQLHHYKDSDNYIHIESSD